MQRAPSTWPWRRWILSGLALGPGVLAAASAHVSCGSGSAGSNPDAGCLEDPDETGIAFPCVDAAEPDGGLDTGGGYDSCACCDDSGADGPNAEDAAFDAEPEDASDSAGGDAPHDAPVDAKHKGE